MFFPVFIRVMSFLVCVSRVCVVSVDSSYDLAKTDTILDMFQHDDAGYTTIKERDLREALDNCVTGDHRKSLFNPPRTYWATSPMLYLHFFSASGIRVFYNDIQPRKKGTCRLWISTSIVRSKRARCT